MGGVVPVAEPVWSGVHLGLCLYAARVLSQDVWDGPVAVTAPSSPSLVRTALPSRDLQRLEAAVRKLSAFVGEVIARRAARRPLSQVDELGRASLAVDAVSAAKRAQLEEAVSKENQQTRLLRAFLNRTAQAIFLLRVLAEHNLPRLVARGDPSLRDAVTKIRFRCANWRAAPRVPKKAIARSKIGAMLRSSLPPKQPQCHAVRAASKATAMPRSSRCSQSSRKAAELFAALPQESRRSYVSAPPFTVLRARADACTCVGARPNAPSADSVAAAPPLFRSIAGTGSRTKRASASRPSSWQTSYPNT